MVIYPKQRNHQGNRIWNFVEPGVTLPHLMWSEALRSGGAAHVRKPALLQRHSGKRRLRLRYRVAVAQVFAIGEKQLILLFRLRYLALFKQDVAEPRQPYIFASPILDFPSYRKIQRNSFHQQMGGTGISVEVRRMRRSPRSEPSASLPNSSAMLTAEYSA